MGAHMAALQPADNDSDDDDDDDDDGDDSQSTAATPTTTSTAPHTAAGAAADITCEVCFVAPLLWTRSSITTVMRIFM